MNTTVTDRGLDIHWHDGYAVTLSEEYNLGWYSYFGRFCEGYIAVTVLRVAPGTIPFF